jgi:hypothetical protein
MRVSPPLPFQFSLSEALPGVSLGNANPRALRVTPRLPPIVALVLWAVTVGLDHFGSSGGLLLSAPHAHPTSTPISSLAVPGGALAAA